MYVKDFLAITYVLPVVWTVEWLATMVTTASAYIFCI